MNELPISFHRKKIPIFAFIISQMRRLNDEWQFPTHWFWPLVNGDNHAYGEPASPPPVGHPATSHHHRTCRHLFIWPTWSGHLSTSSCALCPLQSWPMFHAPSVPHREGPTACTFAMCSTRYMSVFQNTAHTHSECVAVARSLKTRLRTPLRLRGVSRKCLRRTAGGNTYSSIGGWPHRPGPQFFSNNSSKTCNLGDAELIGSMILTGNGCTSMNISYD